MNFFASAEICPFRGVPVQRFGAGLSRTAEEGSVCIHHPRLRYAHLGLIRFDLFEVVWAAGCKPARSMALGIALGK